MPQYFPPNTNAFVKWAVVGGGIFMLLFAVTLTVYARTSNNRVGVPVEQPVAFQHNLHTGQLGIDCRYCHTTVEDSSFANLPSTETCMTCHSMIRVGSPQLEPVFASWETGVPIQWNRVHDLPDFVFFNHSAHLNAGVGCSDCHGRVDQMSQIWKAEPMTMGWCLECHRAPEEFVRPRSDVLNLAYQRPDNQLALGRELVEAYHINTEKLPQCWTCHR